MKIILQEENEVNADVVVSLDDEGFDVPGWVTIRVGAQLQSVHIDELYHASIALYSKYRNQYVDEQEPK